MPPIILGRQMADELGVKVGSPVMVTSPQGELTPFGLVPKYTRFRVAGIFDSGFYDYDSSWAFTRLSDAQRLFALGDVIQIIEFKIDDIYKAAEIGQQLEQAAGPGFMTTNWMEQNKPLFHALRLERLVTFITVGLIVFVAALNILDFADHDGDGEDARHRSADVHGHAEIPGPESFHCAGRADWRFRNGDRTGARVCRFAGWAAHYRLFPLAPEVYSIDYVPFAPRVIDGIWVALVAVGTALVATIYPSWSAARILPAEALRYE